MPRRIRVLAACALFGLVLVGIAAGRIWADRFTSGATDLLHGVRGLGEIGLLIFAVAQILVAISGILPAALLGIAAGAIYGLMTGFIIAAFSTLAGALLAFLLARSLLRDSVERMLARRPRLRDLDRLVAQDGWRIVCLLRVSPVMPFSAASYALGLSGIGMRDYMLGTLASLPALLGYVFLGTLADASLSAWSTGAGTLHWVLLAIGALATVLVTLRIGWLCTRAGILAHPPGD